MTLSISSVFHLGWPSTFQGRKKNGWWVILMNCVIVQWFNCWNQFLLFLVWQSFGTWSSHLCLFDYCSIHDWSRMCIEPKNTLTIILMLPKFDFCYLPLLMSRRCASHFWWQDEDHTDDTMWISRSNLWSWWQEIIKSMTFICNIFVM